MKLFICLFFGMFNLLLCAQTDFDLAENYYDKGELEKALFIYQKLHKEARSNSNLVFRIIEVQQELQHFEEADAFINHQLSLRNNPQMLVEMGYNFQLQNKLEQASVYFKKAIAIAKATPAFCYSIALRFEEHSLVDEAIEVYKLAINQTNNTSYEYRLAGLYAQKKDVQNMFLSYLNFTENNPTFLSQVYRLFGDYISENPDAEYNQILRKILLKKLHTSPSIFWSQMLSWLYTQQKDYQKALLQEKSIFRRNPSSLQGVINVGFRAKSDQVYDVTVDAFNFIIQNAQDSKLTIETHRQLIELELIQSSPQDLNQIQSKYNNLFEIYGRSSETLALQLSYAHFLALYLHNYPEAISFLKTAINTQLSANELGRIKLKLADVLIIDEQFNKALLYYAQVYTTLRNSPLAQEARFKSAKASYYSGDFEWAESQLKVLKSSTSQLIANDALELKLLITDHKFGDSLQSPLRQYAKADLLNHQNKKIEAIEVLNRLIQDHSTHAIVDQALLFQAKLFEQNNQFSNASENYLKIITDFSSEILIDDALYAMAELLRTKLSQDEKAMPYYEKIIFNHPDSIHFVDSNKHYRSLRDKYQKQTTIDL